VTIFVNDTFTDTNGTVLTSHTGETGAVWTALSGFGGAGSLQIQSGKLRNLAAGAQGARPSGTVAGDFAAEMGIVLDDATHSFTAEIWTGAGGGGPSNYEARLEFGNNTSYYPNTAVLIAAGSTPFTLSHVSANPSYVTGHEYILRLEAVGYVLTGFVDGVAVGTLTTYQNVWDGVTLLPVGFRMYDGGGYNCGGMTYFKITDLAGAPLFWTDFRGTTETQ
jgi:hypothetical protein